MQITINKLYLYLAILLFTVSLLLTKTPGAVCTNITPLIDILLTEDLLLACLVLSVFKLLLGIPV
jgi:hypothetical protein